jgi:hypothetical protein
LISAPGPQTGSVTRSCYGAKVCRQRRWQETLARLLTSWCAAYPTGMPPHSRRSVRASIVSAACSVFR